MFLRINSVNDFRFRGPEWGRPPPSPAGNHCGAAYKDDQRRVERSEDGAEQDLLPALRPDGDGGKDPLHRQEQTREKEEKGGDKA